MYEDFTKVYLQYNDKLGVAETCKVAAKDFIVTQNKYT